MERAGQDDPAGAAKSAQLSAARGEYESFQIVIKAPQGGLTNVNVSRPDLRGEKGQVISGKNVWLFREQYVLARSGSPDWMGNTPSGPGLYADALIPFFHPDTGRPLSGAALTAAPFSVDAGKNQPIWVDVFVPRNAAAGAYTATFTIAGDQWQESIPLTLTVWDFTLPLKPTLKTFFELWNDQSKAACTELLRHRVMPDRVNPAWEREFIDTWGLNSANLGFFSGADVKH